MPELIEQAARIGPLPGNGSIDAVIGFLQRLRQHVAGEGRMLARSLHRMEDETSREWKRLCREVAAGRAEDVHAQRDAFLARVQSHLDMLKHVDELARVDGKKLEEAENLSDQIANLEQLCTTLASRWRDTESLEYLVAEALTPAAEKLDAIAANHGFPQAWYDQDDDPFQE
jgi:hypothetical protein